MVLGDDIMNEEILKKEMEINHLSINYKRVQRRLDDKKIKNRKRIIADTLFLTTSIVLYTVLRPISFAGGLTALGVSQLAFNLISYKKFGSRIKEYGKRVRLNEKLVQMEKEMPLLNKELNDMKEKSLEYKENVCYKKETQKLSVINNNNKVKVRKLVKDNNKNS